MLGRVIGNCRIVERLGRGGMGEVWRAEDLETLKPVALKLVSAEIAESGRAIKRFQAEAKATRLLDHPGIARTLRAGTEGEAHFIVMEFVDGETVASRIARGPLAIGETLGIVRDAAKALVHAHARGVFHRDVTSNNIMIDRSGRVVLVDFGLACVSGGSRLTSTGVVLGTPAYLAPEMARGHGADHRSDLYSLGVVFYECLAGRKPFSAETPAAMIQQLLYESPQPPSKFRAGVPGDTDRVVMRLLAKEPGVRFQSARELLDALEPAGPESLQSTASMDVETLGPVMDRPRVLVVLPFREPVSPNASPALDLAEALAASLAQNRNLRVVGPAGVRHLADKGPLVVAEEMGADLIVAGTLLRTGDDLRLLCSIHDPTKSWQRAIPTLDGNVQDLIALQERAIQAVLLELGVSDGTPAPRGSEADVDQDRFAQAVGYLQRFDDEASLEGALRILEGLTVHSNAPAEWLAALARAYRGKFQLSGESRWLDRAHAACRRALARNPESAEALSQLATIHKLQGRVAEAEQEFRRATELQPGDPNILLGMAAMLREQGRLAEAEQAGRRALALNPADWSVLNSLGATLFSGGRFADAVECWRAAARLTPQNARVHSNLGAGLFELGQFDEAQAAFEEAVKLHPTGAAYAGLGTVNFYRGRYADATRLFEKAAGLRPRDPVMWGNLGDACRWASEKHERAQAAYQRAIELCREAVQLNPRDGRLVAYLAEVLVKTGNFDEGRAILDAALELGLQDARDLVRVAATLEILGSRDRALELLAPVLRAKHGHPIVERDPDLGALRADERYLRMASREPGRS